jgi:predicted esterase
MLRLSSDGGSVIASEVSPSASRLVRIDMRSGNVTVLASDESFRGSTVSHRATMIRAADGTPVPIWVSSLADSRARANAAVICVNGGTEIYLRSERWAETQTLLKYGVNVIHIANRKGNGASDVVSACRYAQKELGVPVARTVVLGGSTGASIALDAAVLDPTACGILAVYGVMGSESMPGQTERPPPPGLRLLAFHGGKDSIISPENARMILEQTLGRRTLSPPNGLWHVFENEDHSLHLETSQAAVVATILHVLGVTDCHRP